jgi:NTE family protein
VDLPQLPREADAVFEGGAVKGMAFADEITVCEQAGVEEWKNVAGTSAGAIAAACWPSAITPLSSTAS